MARWLSVIDLSLTCKLRFWAPVVVGISIEKDRELFELLWGDPEPKGRVGDGVLVDGGECRLRWFVLGPATGAAKVEPLA